VTYSASVGRLVPGVAAGFGGGASENDSDWATVARTWSPGSMATGWPLSAGDMVGVGGWDFIVELVCPM
jgi:hypothetical protein